MRVSIALAIALLFTVAACGGGGPPDPDEVYADAGQKMAALISYHVTVEVDAGEFGESSNIDMDVQPPDKFRYAFREAGGTGEISVIGIGGQTFIRLPQSNEFFGPMPEQPFSDFTAFFAALWSGVSDLTYVGDETVENIATHHLQGTVGPEVRRLLEPEASGTGTADLWVGAKDSLVHRLRLAGWDETNTMTFSRFDEPVEIAAPANPRPLEELRQPDLAEQFGAHLTSLPDEAQECLRGKLGDEAFEELLSGSRVNTPAERPAFVECLEEAPPSETSGSSVRIISISPDTSTVLQAGDTVEFEVTVESVLEEESGGVALVIQTGKGVSLTSGSVRTPVSRGTQTVTITRSVPIPEGTKALHVVTPLYLSGAQLTSIADVRRYRVE